jgi:hypothetical protein
MSTIIDNYVLYHRPKRYGDTIMASYKNNKNNTEGLARRLVPWLEGGGVRCGWRTVFFYVGAGESFPRGRIFALKASKSGRIF